MTINATVAIDQADSGDYYNLYHVYCSYRQNAYDSCIEDGHDKQLSFDSMGTFDQVFFELAEVTAEELQSMSHCPIDWDGIPQSEETTHEQTIEEHMIDFAEAAIKRAEADDSGTTHERTIEEHMIDNAKAAIAHFDADIDNVSSLFEIFSVYRRLAYECCIDDGHGKQLSFSSIVIFDQVFYGQQLGSQETTHEQTRPAVSRRTTRYSLS